MGFTGSAQFSYSNQESQQNSVNSVVQDVSETVRGYLFQHVLFQVHGCYQACVL